ncbi:hypothetical protein N431DRAFT_435721 [Stipitochalara longipes BDJ]|nr:hypothetical protein N431DRAFT_435721 [Stipitochalara longipes BDJ]
MVPRSHASEFLNPNDLSTLLDLVDASENERKETLIQNQKLLTILEDEKSARTMSIASDSGELNSLAARQHHEKPQSRILSLNRDALDSSLRSTVSSTTDSRPTNSSREAGLAEPEEETEVDMLTNARLGLNDASKFKFKCDKCEKSFTRSTTLQEHGRTHSDERCWACHLCPKRFVRRKDCRRHTLAQHTQKKVECGRSMKIDGRVWEWGCRRRFSREDGLTSHLRTEKGWKCLQSLLDIDQFMFHSELQDCGKVRIGNRLRCASTRNPCREEFDAMEQWRRHVNAPTGRNCVTDWLVRHIVVIYRGRSRIELITSLSDDGGKNSLAQEPNDGQIANRHPDDHEPERPRETPIVIESARSSASVLLLAEGPLKQSTNSITNNGKDGLVSENVAHPEASKCTETPTANTVSSATVVDYSANLESIKDVDTFNNCTVVTQSQAGFWLPGDPFWVLVNCSEPLEGSFFFMFGTDLEAKYSFATVAPEKARQGLSQQYLHKLSGVVPLFVEARNDGLQVSVCRNFDLQSQRRQACFFVGWITFGSLKRFRVFGIPR